MINWVLANYCATYKRENDDMPMLPTARMISMILRPLGVSNTQQSTSNLLYRNGGPDVRAFITTGQVDVHNIWGCQRDGDAPENLMPGTGLYFGLKLRRVQEPYVDGSVDLQFKLAERGPAYHVKYAHPWLWELVPFTLERGEIPDVFGKFPETAVTTVAEKRLGEDWTKIVDEEFTWPGGLYGQAPAQHVYKQVIYPGYWWKFGIVSAFPATGSSFGFSVGDNVKRDVTQIERLPVVEVKMDYNGLHATMIE